LRKIFSLSTIGINKDKTEPNDSADASTPQPAAINTKETYELHYDDHGANFRFAECCSPIPGDAVLGFIDDNGEVEVHSIDCPRALALKAGYGPRLLSTRWAGTTGKYLAHVRVEGIDRFGILQEIISTISTHMSIDIRSLNIAAEKEVFHCDLTVLVDDANVVNDLCDKLKKVNGVSKAVRIH
jgi:GTP pyrophosphokinase